MAARLILAAAALALATGCTGRAERIESGLRKGDACARAGQWDKAGLEARNVLQLDPKDARAWALAGRVAEHRGEAMRAFEAYARANELAPADLDDLLALARVELVGGEAARAATHVEAILRARPDHVGARTLQAALALQRGDEDAALAQLRAIVAPLAAPPPDTALLLGGLLVRRGDAAGALALLEGALRAAPDDARLVAAAAAAAEAAGAGADDPALAARAVAWHRRATALAPLDFAPWRAWAAFHQRRGEADAAEAVLRDAIRAAPDDDARRVALLELVRRQRGAEAAERATLAAIAERPRAAPLRFCLARQYESSGRPADAARVLSELVALDPQAPAALAAQDRLAERALAAGDAASAARYVDATLRASPRDLDALLLRGRLRLAQGRAADAVADLRAAARERPDAEAVGLLARAHHAASEPQLARDVLADAVHAHPDDASLRLLLAADLADSGDRAAADRELDEALRRAPRDPRAAAAKLRLAGSRGRS